MDLHVCKCGETLMKASERKDAVDTCVAGYLKYKGEEDSGLVTIAVTTGDMSFKHGATGSEVADTTVNPTGTTPGPIDLSTEAATFAPLGRLVNFSANWEWWWHAALPTEATEDSGTAKIVNNLTDQQCKLANGYAVLIDTDPAFWHSVAVTAWGPSSDPHGFDAGWYHQIEYINAGSTFASGASVLKIYAVNDDRWNPTVEELYSFTMTSPTAKYLPKLDERWPIYNVEGKRFVLKIENTLAMTLPTLEIFFGSCKCAPGVRRGKLFDQKSL